MREVKSKGTYVRCIKSEENLILVKYEELTWKGHFQQGIQKSGRGTNYEVINFLFIHFHVKLTWPTTLFNQILKIKKKSQLIGGQVSPTKNIYRTTSIIIKLTHKPP